MSFIPQQVEDASEILIRQPQCLRLRLEILGRYITLSLLRHATSNSYFSLASVGHMTGHMVSPMVPIAAILENLHSEQPCYGFLLKFLSLCSQTSTNLVNCFLTIVSLVSHVKDFDKISVLQAQLWDLLVLRTILAFLFSGKHTNHHSRVFFCIEMTRSKNFDPESKTVTYIQVLYYINAEKLKKKNSTFRSPSGARELWCWRLLDTLDFGQIKITNGKNALNSSNLSAIVKIFV